MNGFEHHGNNTFLTRPYVDVAYYNMGFGPAIQQLTTVVVWVPLQIASFMVYPVFKVSI